MTDESSAAGLAHFREAAWRAFSFTGGLVILIAGLVLSPQILMAHGFPPIAAFGSFVLFAAVGLLLIGVGLRD